MKARMEAEDRRRDRGIADPQESEGQRVILGAALDAFLEHGFHGTAVRDIAARAGLSVAAIYYHFPSKLDILYTIMVVVIDDTIEHLIAKRDAAGDDPAAQIGAMVRWHVKVHTRRKAEAFISNTELRSLDKVRRQAIVARRDRIADLFEEVVRAGIARGAFDAPWPREAVRAILTMIVGVAGWYRKEGPETPDAIADRYAEIAMRVLGRRAS
jgi:AcrR family transcriptional regulator